jgi:maltodextrin utilization protein YvdJ
MSVLISIFIFIITIYVIVLPYKTVTNNQKDKFIKDNTLGVLGLYEMDNDTFNYNEIKDKGFQIKDQKLTSSIEDDDEVQHYKVEYTTNGEKRVVNIIFDPYNNRTEKVNLIKKEYDTKYNITDSSSDSEKNKAYYISNLVFIEKLNNSDLDINAKIEELYALPLTEIEKISNEMDGFDLYNVERHEDSLDFIVVFNQDIMIYVGEKAGEENLTAATIRYSKDFDLKFNQLSSSKEFGETISNYIVQMYILTIQNQQTLQIIFSTLIAPIILVFIVWLLYRKKGTLKTYKEYYNIAAICSVIPTIIIFVLTWFWLGAIIIHAALMLVFYVFALYRINTMPLDV